MHPCAGAWPLFVKSWINTTRPPSGGRPPLLALPPHPVTQSKEARNAPRASPPRTGSSLLRVPPRRGEDQLNFLRQRRRRARFLKQSIDFGIPTLAAESILMRHAMKARLTVGLIILLCLVAAFLWFFPGPRFRLMAFVSQERFYEDRPTSYWLRAVSDGADGEREHAAT